MENLPSNKVKIIKISGLSLERNIAFFLEALLLDKLIFELNIYLAN